MFGLHSEILPKLNTSLELQPSHLVELDCGLVENIGYQSLPLQKLCKRQIHTIRISHRLMAESSDIERA